MIARALSVLAGGFGILVFFGCSPVDRVAAQSAVPQSFRIEGVDMSQMETIVLGGGCFWCVEAIYRDVIGVVAVENGYAGGHVENPTYEQVLTGRTGHAEVVRVDFDPEQISGEDLLRIFFTVHDPTTLNRQGNDVGTQYRSVIFYTDEAEKTRAQAIMDEITAEEIWPDPIVTTLEPLVNYTRAEEYHQDYFHRFENATPEERAQMNAGYCQFVIEPKVRKFRDRFSHLLRSRQTVN